MERVREKRGRREDGHEEKEAVWKRLRKKRGRDVLVILTLQQQCSHMLHESPPASEIRDLNTRRQHHQ